MSQMTSTLLKSQTSLPFIPYPQLTVLRVAGPDATRFLQGQLTCDLTLVSDTTAIAGGHCDATGKLWAVFRIVRSAEDYLLLCTSSLLTHVMEQFKKFSVFSKVTFTDETEQWQCGWYVGKDANERCAQDFSVERFTDYERPSGQYPVTHSAQGLILAIHPAAYLVLSTRKASTSEISDISAHAVEMSLGWPLLSPEHQQQHIPQTLNLDKLGGISFKKGCYIGQETVARMHYKGQTKRRLAFLLGNAAEIPTNSDTLEVQMGESWRRAGAVLAAVRYHDVVIALQAVLPVEVEATARFRIKGQNDSQFTLCPLQESME